MDAHGWTVNSRGCWVYGNLTYGRVNRRSAHRVAYERWIGPIPENHVVRHRCNNPPCVNPDHLETGTQSQNNQDTVNSGHRSDFFGMGLVDRSAGRVSPEDAQRAVRMYWAGATPSKVAKTLGISKAVARQMIPAGWRWDAVSPP